MSSNTPGRGGRGGTNQPTQAGRFKPKKRVSTPATSSAAGRSPRAPTPSAPGGRTGRGRGGRTAVRDNAGGRGRGRGRGRDGRGRGRGRFVAPKGKVFFTGEDASSASDGTGTAKSKDTSSKEIAPKESSGIILMPGGSSSMSSSSRGALSGYGKTAQDRIAAASLSRQGEGEEVIVGELESSIGSGVSSKKTRILDRTSGSDANMPSMFDDPDEDEPILDESAYQFDSDSSTDGQDKRERQAKRSHGRSVKILQPQQLPVPPPRKPGTQQINYLYDCQKEDTEVNDGAETHVTNAIEEDKTSQQEDTGTKQSYESPFISNFQDATPDEQREELQSWMIFKFPTRLPRLNPNSTLSGRAMKQEATRIKDENNMDLSDAGQDLSSGPVPDSTISMNPPQSSNTMSSSIDTPSTNGTSAAASSYDDTLKDAATGRYGKIVIHKSGKCYLLIGNENDSPIRMQLSEGLPCSFLQQAVAINTEKTTPISMSIHDNGEEQSEGSYITLGEVRKSLVVTPDIESAFPM